MKIRIECSQVVRCSQYKEISEAAWAKLKETPGRQMNDEDRSPLIDLLDFRDVYSSESFDDVEITVVDEQCEPIKPIDCYEGDAA
jgi:hypothetical protein